MSGQPRLKIRWAPRLSGKLRRVYRALRPGIWAPVRKSIPSSIHFGPPRGEFSAIELVRKKAVPGAIIQEAGSLPPMPAGSLRAMAGMWQNSIAPWSVFWSLHGQAQLVGASLILRDESKRLCTEAAYFPYCKGVEPAYYAWKLPPASLLEGKWTSIVSLWTSRYPGFYHWIMDVLPRLSRLKEFPEDTRILVPPRLRNYEVESLKLLGLSGRIRPTGESHLKVEDYYFSSPSAMSGCYDPYAVAFLRSAFLQFADTAFITPKRFFLHRIGKSRGIVNEKAVLEVFKKRGWPIIDTENLTLAQQIQLFKNAEAVCALHGAGLVNMVWSPPATKIIELVSDTYINGVYEGLAQMIGADYRFVVCRGDSDAKAYVPIPILEELLP
jgi:capsular polysaccharide biosynthesis protein